MAVLKLVLLLLLTGLMVVASSQDACGWPEEVEVSDIKQTFVVLAYNASQTDTSAQVNCSTTFVTGVFGNVMSLHVEHYNISQGLSIEWNDTEEPDISWRENQFAGDMTIRYYTFQVRYTRPPGISPLTEDGFSLHFRSLGFLEDEPCPNATTTLHASQKTGLLFSPQYPLGTSKDAICKWNIEAPPGFVLDVNLASVSHEAGLLIDGESRLQMPRMAGKTNAAIQNQKNFGTFVLEYTAVPMKNVTCSANATKAASDLGDWYVLQWRIQREETDLDCEMTFDTGSDETVVEVTLTDYRLSTGGDSCADQTLRVTDVSTGTVLVNESTPQGGLNCPGKFWPFSTIRASGRRLTVALSSKKHGNVNDAVLTLVVKSRDIFPVRNTDVQVLEQASSVSYAWIPADQISPSGDLKMTMRRTLSGNCSVLEVWDKTLDSRLVIAQRLSVYNGLFDEYFELTKDCSGNVPTNRALYPRRMILLVMHRQNEGFWIRYQANSGGPCQRVYTPVVGTSYTLSETIRSRKQIDCSWHITNDGLIALKTNFSSNTFLVLTGNPNHESQQPLLTHPQTTRPDPNLWLYSYHNLTIDLTVTTPTPESSLEFQYKTLAASSTVKTSCPLQDLTATREIQGTSSVNYPDYLMSGMHCQWNITRADPRDLLVIDVVLNSRFLKNKSAKLSVYLYSPGISNATEVSVPLDSGILGFSRAFPQETTVVSLEVTRPVMQGLFFNYFSIHPEELSVALCNKTFHLGDGPISRSVTFVKPFPSTCRFLFSSGSDKHAVILTNMTYDFSSPLQIGKVRFFSVFNNTINPLETIAAHTKMTPNMSIVSQKNEMLVQVDLRTLVERPLKFTFTADTIPITGCGGTSLTITVPSTGEYQNITSPNYPEPYPPNSLCRYILKPQDATKLIEINLVDLDVPRLQPNKSCFNDYNENDDLLVINRIYHFCNNSLEQNNPINITNADGEIYFVSGSELEGRGFLIRFRAIDGFHYHFPLFDTNNDYVIGIVCGVTAGVFLIGTALFFLIWKRTGCLTSTQPAVVYASDTNNKVTMSYATTSAMDSQK
ncbi:uncharacterized protein LOC101858363 [Aplysia californica]|uniref:Uncharacterized protein LOC101858363 n=1 Tax=Aplysia californica TaxID=6500 RepID=A0ABM0K5A5_APLCA|nr:uncharacterized protein LOC101858363 [Aplysia californica]